GGMARLQFCPLMQSYCSNSLGGKGVEVHPGAILERLGIFEKRNLDLDPLRSLKCARRRQCHTPRQVFKLYSCQIERRALPSQRLFGGGAMDLYAAHSRPSAAGEDFYLVFLLDFSRDQRSRNHRAKAFHGEHPVNGKAKESFRVASRDLG